MMAVTTIPAKIFPRNDNFSKKCIFISVSYNPYLYVIVRFCKVCRPALIHSQAKLRCISQAKAPR